MKLLIITQVVDLDDPVLGFFHGWVEEIAKHVDFVEVICLRKGKYALPENVAVHSLGKEEREATRLQYVLRLYALLWKLRGRYERVFVHMNQEYVLLAGLYWRLFRKPTYLWRNHYAGSILTDIAGLFCTKVFCTSKHSYTAKYQKTVLMPVGVDTQRFSPEASVGRVPRSILFLARISPSKRPDMLLDALEILSARGTEYTAAIVGSPVKEDISYYQKIVDRGEKLNVRFIPAVPNHKTLDLYRTHEIFVNASPSGMFDKTIFEAAACGCIVLASSNDFRDAAGDEYAFSDALSLEGKLSMLLDESEKDRERRSIHLTSLARTESLSTLADRLWQEALS